MKPMNIQDNELFFAAVLSLRSAEECKLFFEDVCTIKELQAMGQRFDVACRLDADKNYNEITEDTGASSATICRVNKCLLYGDGGYRTIIDRLKQEGTIK